jgi:hypothetical protein
MHSALAPAVLRLVPVSIHQASLMPALHPYCSACLPVTSSRYGHREPGAPCHQHLRLFHSLSPYNIEANDPYTYNQSSSTVCKAF